MDGNVEGSDDKGRQLSAIALGLKKLNEQQIRQIDMALESVGDYGEVRLIIQHGQLRYINRVESHRAWDNYDGKKADG